MFLHYPQNNVDSWCMKSPGWVVDGSGAGSGSPCVCGCVLSVKTLHKHAEQTQQQAEEPESQSHPSALLVPPLPWSLRMGGSPASTGGCCPPAARGDTAAGAAVTGFVVAQMWRVFSGEIWLFTRCQRPDELLSLRQSQGNVHARGRMAVTLQEERD